MNDSILCVMFRQSPWSECSGSDRKSAQTNILKWFESAKERREDSPKDYSRGEVEEERERDEQIVNVLKNLLNMRLNYKKSERRGKELAVGFGVVVGVVWVC